jgi:hypothetical protein
LFCISIHFNEFFLLNHQVFRGWFDKQLNSAPEILETPDYSPINLIAQYHLLEEEFITWAKSTGGSGKFQVSFFLFFFFAKFIQFLSD